jgi:uncharacterized membrane protein (DUF4010 family)
MEPLQPELLASAARMGAALGAGLVVGLERGWKNRELPEGGRVAGLRTFALIGLLGGLLGLADSALAAAAGLVGVASLFAVSYRRSAHASGTLSITTAIAALVTFSLGVAAGRGQIVVAVAGAALVALLLDLKGVLHGWLRRIQAAELTAALQLGVLTVVVLPLLPDAGFGPYQALNPFQLWVAVILVASLSLTGHVAARLRGRDQGLLWVGLLGGLASSTAATLALSRSAREDAGVAGAASAGIVAASGVMFSRLAAIVTLLQPGTALRLVALLLALGIVLFALAAWFWRRRDAQAAARPVEPGGLFDLGSAVGFAAVLGLVAVLSRAARDWLGVPGLMGVAFLSGLADVDAIAISTVQMLGSGELVPPLAAQALLLAVAANMLMKAGITWVVGGRAVGWPVTGAYLLTGAVGVLASMLA